MDELVVGCLTRAYEAMTGDQSLRTQKGRKEIGKTLVLLEKALLQRLQDMKDAAGMPDTDRLREMFAALADDLQIEELAREYVRKCDAAEQSEARMLRYLSRQTPDAICQGDIAKRLQESGVAPAQWQQLCMQSGLPPTPSDGEAGPAGPINPRQQAMLGALRASARDLDQISAQIRDVLGRLK